MQKSSDNRYNTQAIENMDMDFISVECLEKLGLDQNPFIDHARDPFLFVDKQLEMSMNVLIDYLLNQNSTIVLLGEVGIGKTTHLRMLLRKGYQQFNFCTLRAKPKTTFTEIEEKIKERWRLPHLSDEDVSLLDIDSNEYLTTDEHIKKYIEDDKQPVLIIDDAHRLQNNVLDELLKLKHHVGLQSPRAMGLVLASEPGLKTQLAELEQTNPAATQIYQVNVRSFDANQCEEYIQYRMSKAGAITDSSFNSEKISEIYSRSKGLPKHINKLAREEIAKMCEQNVVATGTMNKLKSNPSMRLGLILGGLIALVALLAALSKCSNETNETVVLDIEKPKIEQKTTSPELEPKPNAEPNSAPKSVSDSEPKNTTIAKPYVAPLVLGPIQEDKKDAIDTVQQTKTVTKVEKPNTTEQNKTPATDKATTKTSSYSSDWILKQDPNAYTIQIVASLSETNLIDFAKKNSLKEDTAYYQKSSADKTWFILVHGVYASRDEALKNIEQLSDTLKKNTPYPIQIKYLQEVIRQQ
jgi:DamX protein